jgi:hypothetical protein
MTGPASPYTGKVLKENADSWHHGLSPSSRQDRLESILLALEGLADAGLGAASVLANLHHKQIVPLMERELRIYEMSEAANPMSLARSRLLNDRFTQEYAATRARCAISLKAGRYNNDELWSFIMLPDALAVSRLSSFLYSLATHRCDLDSSFFYQRVAVDASRSDPPTPRARAAARSAQRREQERAAHRKERSIRRREHREQQSKKYRLREQQGLSPRRPQRNRRRRRRKKRRVMGAGSSREVDSPTPSPRAAEAAEELAPVMGAEAPATGRSVEEAACAAEASGSAVTAVTDVTAASAEPSRKRKRGFSTLR